MEARELSSLPEDRKLPLQAQVGIVLNPITFVVTLVTNEKELVGQKFSMINQIFDLN